MFPQGCGERGEGVRKGRGESGETFLTTLLGDLFSKTSLRCFDNLKHLPVTDPPFLSTLTSHRRLPLFVFLEGSARSFVEEAGSGLKLIARATGDMPKCKCAEHRLT
jgi:hypothetical protein